MQRHLRTVRVALALAVLAPAALAFLDFGRLLPASWAAAVAQVQLVPALFRLPALGAGLIFIVVSLGTVLLGRVYCSTLCPLGTVQDLLLRLRTLGRGRRARLRFLFKPKRTAVHLGVAAVVVGLAVLGVLSPLSLLEPWSGFGRLLATLGRPPVAAAVNGVSGALASAHVYAVQPLAAPVAPWPAIAIAVGWLLSLILFTFRRGRLFCNLLCPAGALLHLLARRSVLRIRLDEARCNGCGVCERACKAGCIDATLRQVDAGACVGCFDCLEACPKGGVVYGRPPAPPAREDVPAEEVASARGRGQGGAQGTQRGTTRRALLAGAAAAGGGLLLPASGRGAAPAGPPADPRDARAPILPPGAGALRRFTAHCTACQLCVAACPTGVLRPSLLEYGLAGLLQPRLVYDHGACVFDCHRCGEVCPTGAITALPLETKHLVQVGRAVFVKDECVVTVKKKACGACAEHCPTKAIQMIPVEGGEPGLRVPRVDEALCIGCGSCEHPCPTLPRKAIWVEARTPQGTAKRPEVKPLANPLENGDFPF